MFICHLAKDEFKLVMFGGPYGELMNLECLASCLDIYVLIVLFLPIVLYVKYLCKEIVILCEIQL